MASRAKKALKQAQLLARQGRSSEAADLYRRIAAAFPQSAEARQALAALGKGAGTVDPASELRFLYSRRQYAEAIAAAARLPAAAQRSPAVQNIVGGAEMARSRPDRAEAAFRKAIKVAPDRAAGYYNLGLALRAQNKLSEARAAFRQALELRPDYGDAQNGLGMVLRDEGDIGGAEAAFVTASRLKPDDPEIWTNLGNVHHQRSDFDAAFTAYRKALSLAPDHANAHYNYGLSLKAAGRLTEAVEHYQSAVAANPGLAQAHNNLGNALRALGKLPQAEAAHRRAAELQPGDAEAHTNLAYALQSMGRFDEAVDAYSAALEVAPHHSRAKAARIYLLAQMCDWRAHREFAPVADALGVTEGAVAPFDLLSLEDAPARQRQRAERYARATFGEEAPPSFAPAAAARRPERLRIGYFSADFRSHPVARLIAGTFAAHDRERFELFGYSFGPGRQDDFRRELSAHFARFTDIRAVPDAEAAWAIAEDRLDIAIDLTLYTQHSRTALFSRRIAPVQINYLGYPGTSGAPFMDYIIADPVVVPPGMEPHLSEAVIRLPHCYQPNDDRRAVPWDGLSRADHGLPETGPVLCSFNSAYKITPREFDIWMRILDGLPGAVLWLLESTRWARGNLMREAEVRGVDPARLVFAPRVPNEEHLARHRHADLFLDTFAYNAHTTGSDALWMGLPVVTLAGRQFAARVGASLLNAVGLPELVAESEADYETLVLELAHAPDRLAELRQKLDDDRYSVPLFQTGSHTRALEAALEAAHERWREGREPADLSVPSGNAGAGCLAPVR